MSFSESGPKWSRTAVRITSASAPLGEELPDLLGELLLAGPHRRLLPAGFHGLRDDAVELEPDRLRSGSSSL